MENKKVKIYQDKNEVDILIQDETVRAGDTGNGVRINFKDETIEIYAKGFFKSISTTDFFNKVKNK